MAQGNFHTPPSLMVVTISRHGYSADDKYEVLGERGYGSCAEYKLHNLRTGEQQIIYRTHTNPDLWATSALKKERAKNMLQQADKILSKPRRR